MNRILHRHTQIMCLRQRQFTVQFRCNWTNQRVPETRVRKSWQPCTRHFADQLLHLFADLRRQLGIHQHGPGLADDADRAPEDVKAMAMPNNASVRSQPKLARTSASRMLLLSSRSER